MITKLSTYAIEERPISKFEGEQHSQKKAIRYFEIFAPETLFTKQLEQTN
jgi:hypothetical protein